MPDVKAPAFAEAPALRKASGGGASRRQANFKSMSKFKEQISNKYLTSRVDIPLPFVKFVIRHWLDHAC